ncbi:glycosyltransferase family 2 protein [Propionivibrio sp.]|uniref:glycosyltransferase family 2 protein n=1 Tax=Propionivibrio sp. TaxID=2212460 RepID=UPI003BF03C59
MQNICKKKHGVSVVLICLNDSKCIGQMLNSILKSSPSEIIVVDGGSIDSTIEIAAQYTDKVYQSHRGMLNQTLYGMNLVEYDHVFLAESDHVYPESFLNDLFVEYLASEFHGLQAQLAYPNRRNFFEVGHGEFYKIHFSKKGIRPLIACPQIWRYEYLDQLLKVTNKSQGFSFDTQRGEVGKALKLTVGVGYTMAYEMQEIDFSKFMKRHTNYGEGDYEFYCNNYGRWSTVRKLKSLTHVLLRYFVIYPCKSLYYGNPLVAVPYFWLVGLVRYRAWFLAWIKNSVFKEILK